MCISIDFQFCEHWSCWPMMYDEHFCTKYWMYFTFFQLDKRVDLVQFSTIVQNSFIGWALFGQYGMCLFNFFWGGQLVDPSSFGQEYFYHSCTKRPDLNGYGYAKRWRKTYHLTPGHTKTTNNLAFLNDPFCVQLLAYLPYHLTIISSRMKEDDNFFPFLTWVLLADYDLKSC